MSDTAWKRTEREIASRVGGVRVPITGRARGSAPDVQHPWLSIERKHRKAIPLWIADGMAQAVASARDGQLPVVIVHEGGQRHGNDIVMVKLRDWTEWFGGGADAVNDGR